MRIPFGEMHGELLRVLLNFGFREDRAELCARLFTESSLDGVYSHGLDRFPRFCKMVENGSIDIHAEPECVGNAGALEQWDGRLGPGNLNAHASMQRALELAGTHGVGAVALRNTNHWMRGGTYGWQAADAGMVGLCWTNTMQNMPAWGSREPRLGNGPLVIAIPRSAGHVVLDMSPTQFSYGTLASFRRDGRELPVDGGFDSDGRLTRDPGAIEQSGRPLPAGFWKGAGLSLVLDLAAAMLSGGRSTRELSRDPLLEVGLSQVFVALDPRRFNENGSTEQLVDAVIEHFHGSMPVSPESRVRYPGERVLETRMENLEKGIPVDAEIWTIVTSM